MCLVSVCEKSLYSVPYNSTNCILMKLELQYNKFHTRKSLCKCHLQNGGHLFWASMYLGNDSDTQGCTSLFSVWGLFTTTFRPAFQKPPYIYIRACSVIQYPMHKSTVYMIYNLNMSNIGLKIPIYRVIKFGLWRTSPPPESAPTLCSAGQQYVYHV